MDELEAFRYSGHEWQPKSRPVRKARMEGAFIRGPIPLDWLSRAAAVPRRNAVLVGLVLFYLAGLCSKRTGLVLSVKRCELLGLKRKAVQRGLADLEAAELVRVQRSVGRCPRVDILESEEADE